MRKYVAFAPAAAAFVVGFLLVFFIMPAGGALMTHDSVAYVKSGESLLEKGSLIYFGYNTPMIQWPPLYSLFCAAQEALGLDPGAAAKVLNPLLFAVTAALSAGWIFKKVRSRAAAAVWSAAAVFSAPLIFVSLHLWSELMFILLSLCALIFIEKYMEKGTRAAFFTAAVFAAATWITRYAGIALVAACAAALLLKKGSFLARIGRAAGFGTLASLPMVFWFIRNIRISGTLTGGRGASGTGFIQNKVQFIKTIVKWFFPTDSGKLFGVFTPLGMIVLIIALLAFCAVIALGIIKAVKAERFTGIRSLAFAIAHGCGAHMLYFIFYSAFILLSATLYQFDALDTRLLSPLYLPLLFSAGVLLDRVAERAGKTVILKLAAVLPMLLILILPTAQVISETAALAKNTGYGVGYNTNWSESKIVKELNEFNKMGWVTEKSVIFSNAPDALAYYTGLNCLYFPKYTGLKMYSPIYVFTAPIEKADTTLIAWFDMPENPNLYTPEKMGLSMSFVSVYKEGTLYSLN